MLWRAIQISKLAKIKGHLQHRSSFNSMELYSHSHPQLARAPLGPQTTQSYGSPMCSGKAASKSRPFKCSWFRLFIIIALCSWRKIKSTVMGNKTSFPKLGHIYSVLIKLDIYTHRYYTPHTPICSNF